MYIQKLIEDGQDHEAGIYRDALRDLYNGVMLVARSVHNGDFMKIDGGRTSVLIEWPMNLTPEEVRGACRAYKIFINDSKFTD